MNTAGGGPVVNAFPINAFLYSLLRRSRIFKSRPSVRNTDFYYCASSSVNTYTRRTIRFTRSNARFTGDDAPFYNSAVKFQNNKFYSTRKIFSGPTTLPASRLRFQFSRFANGGEASPSNTHAPRGIIEITPPPGTNKYETTRTDTTGTHPSSAVLLFEYTSEVRVDQTPTGRNQRNAFPQKIPRWYSTKFSNVIHVYRTRVINMATLRVGYLFVLNVDKKIIFATVDLYGRSYVTIKDRKNFLVKLENGCFFCSAKESRSAYNK